MIEIAVKNENGNVWEKVARHFKEKKINILEIGVYKAAQIGEAYSHCNINSYVGVDPYLGDDSDSYRGCYWKDEAGADEIYKQSNKVFEKWGGGIGEDNIRNVF